MFIDREKQCDGHGEFHPDAPQEASECLGRQSSQDGLQYRIDHTLDQRGSSAFIALTSDQP
jgi:hypothetical protein